MLNYPDFLRHRYDEPVALAAGGKEGVLTRDSRSLLLHQHFHLLNWTAPPYVYKL